MDQNITTQTSQDTDFTQFLDQVEKDLVQHIYNNIEKDKLSPIKAKTLAQEFLKLLPAKDKEDLLDKLNKLGQNYEEARQVYADYAIPYEQEKRQRLLDTMREQIKNGNIEKAIEIAKGGYTNV